MAQDMLSRMRYPGEWEPHQLTIMGWPCRQELWGATLAQAQQDYADVANAVAAFEPVTMIANPGSDAALARSLCAGSVTIVELPIDDSWLRDSGPVYVTDDSPSDERGAKGVDRAAVHFGFNAWGGKYPPWDKDALVGASIAQHLGDRVVEAPFILEGGSVISDGAGTILTTEQCLLNPNRNPSLTREQIEELLGHYLGATSVVWLERGLIEDRDTDGHVDLVAAYTRAGEALLQTVPEDNHNFENCQENLRRLQRAGISVVEIPYLPYTEVADERVAASYLNFYVCNDAVIVPVTGADTDTDALAIIAKGYPEREVVPVPGGVLAFGGGGPHCITQQVPRV
jgi:agmatine deiminase